MSVLIERLLAIPMPIRLIVVVVLTGILAPWSFVRGVPFLLWILAKALFQIVSMVVDLYLYLDYLVVRTLRKNACEVPSIIYISERLFAGVVYCAKRIHVRAARFNELSLERKYKTPALWLWSTIGLFTFLWVVQPVMSGGGLSQYLRQIQSSWGQVIPFGNDSSPCAQYRLTGRRLSSGDLETIDNLFYEETGIRVVPSDALPEIKQKWCSIALRFVN